METQKKYMKIIIPVIVAVFFAGGYWYGTSSTTKPQNPSLGNMQDRQFGGQGQNGQGMMRGGGMVQGEILSIDDTGITVKGRDGGSKIVIMSTSTKVFKSVDTNKADLKVGTNVMVAGTANTDGSVSANSVSIRNDMQFATTTKQ